jgi:competence protein ComEA
MLQRARTFVAGLLTGLLAAGLLWLLIAGPRGDPIVLKPPPTSGPIRVHVSGEVLHPGVYTLPIGSIAQTALEAAGGPTSDAEVSLVNLAASLSDGQQVHIPRVVEATSQIDGAEVTSPFRGTPAASLGRVDVNLASAPELELLPGIGPSLAQKIIDYRETNGPFRAPDDLLQVSGIGPAKLEALLDWIRLE